MNKLFEELLRARDFGPDFLCPDYENSIDPALLPDIDAAVDRIRTAVTRGETVLIYGDYDVDGVTASTIMHDTLKLAGIKSIEIMLPNRFTDGYGMSPRIITKAQDIGAQLVITVDCGSRNHAIIDQLNQSGIDVIVTDHHECADTLPAALAVINPKRPDFPQKTTTQNSSPKSQNPKAQNPTNQAANPESLKDLSGAGVAFKLAQALVQAGMIPAGQEKWLLDLVLIGTICDSMRLTGENRLLCFYGLKVLEKTRRPGLKELIRTIGIQRFTGESIGFQIGPRLNAAGRMETAEHALDLLMATSRPRAAALATVLDGLNLQRRSEQNSAVAEIDAQGLSPDPVIIVQGDWHEGVLGIIAGRLVESYRRPAFVLAACDGVLKGSGRSFGDFNLAEALKACESCIISGGGHAEACGVKVAPDNFDAFRQAMNDYYHSLALTDQSRFLDLPADLILTDFSDLTLELLADLRRLEPFGPGNAEPIFLLQDARIMDVARLGADGDHLRLTVWDNSGKSLKLIQFYAPAANLSLTSGTTANIWIQLTENEFRGIRSVEGRILKISP